MSRARTAIRACGGCRSRRPATTFVRLARDENGPVRVVGVAGIVMVPGRATHVCPTQRCVRRVMGRMERRRKVTKDEATQVLAQAEGHGRQILAKRIHGLRRRRIDAVDPTCRALRSMCEDIERMRCGAGDGA